MPGLQLRPFCLYRRSKMSWHPPPPPLCNTSAAAGPGRSGTVSGPPIDPQMVRKGPIDPRGKPSATSARGACSTDRMRLPHVGSGAAQVQRAHEQRGHRNAWGPLCDVVCDVVLRYGSRRGLLVDSIVTFVLGKCGCWLVLSAWLWLVFHWKWTRERRPGGQRRFHVTLEDYRRWIADGGAAMELPAGPHGHGVDPPRPLDPQKPEQVPAVLWNEHDAGNKGRKPLRHVP